MEKDRRLRIYSIMFLICLVLLFTSIPFTLFIKNNVLLFVVTSLIRVASIIYIFYYIKKEGLEKMKLKRLNKKILIYIPLLVLCCSNLFVVLFTNRAIKENILIQNILFGLMSAILIAIGEELLFRGLLFNEMKNTLGIKKGIIYSSLIFGAIHLLNINSLASIPICIIQSLYTFALGVILAILYNKTENIFIPIIFHLLFNFMNNTLTVELFNINWDITFFIVNICVGLITFIYLFFVLYFSKKGEIDNVTKDMDY